jgi:hypothetical protein
MASVICVMVAFLHQDYYDRVGGAIAQENKTKSDVERQSLALASRPRELVLSKFLLRGLDNPFYDLNRTCTFGLLIDEP